MPDRCRVVKGESEKQQCARDGSDTVGEIKWRRGIGVLDVIIYNFPERRLINVDVRGLPVGEMSMMLDSEGVLRE